MRNLFPIQNTDLGDATIPIQPDEPNVVLNQSSMSNGMMQPNRPMVQPGMDSPFANTPPVRDVRIGGTLDPYGVNKRPYDAVYEGYKKPALQAGNALAAAGEKANPSLFDQNQVDRKFEIDEGDANLDRQVKQSLIDSRSEKKLKVVTITDPSDPTKQISANYDQETGTVTPIALPNNGRITNASNPTQIQKKIDDDKLKATQRNAVKEKAQRTLDELDQIIDPVTGKLGQRGQAAVGADRFVKYLPWPTKSYEGNKSIERIKNLLTLDLMGEMKAQSRTGATGFGNMALREFGALEAAASKMDSKLGEENFEEQAKVVRKHLNDILTDSTNDSTADTTTDKTTTDKSGQASQAPQAPEGYEYVRRPDNKGWTAVKKVSK